MRLVQVADAVRYERMTTAEIRESFLVDGLAQAGKTELAYIDLDRTVVGFAMPQDETLTLPCPSELRAEYFCERRELGVLNIGGSGSVIVDEVSFALGKLDCLYVGRGSKSVRFKSDDATKPAMFYLLSYPAHAQWPTSMVKRSEIKPVELGSLETCNHRNIHKAIHLEGIRSSQLVMGFTLLKPGSNWNTMPPHTHMRRSEIYMYFDLDEGQRVLHLMGPRNSTKHIVMGNCEVVVSPGWSIHSGVGTKAYGFCWGMGGENQRYDDMDPVTIPELR